ncbi:MAG: UMP kinase [Leptospiraceae bacterium]|nr:UMP kinase [Leptospiraceae bacterium]MDW8306477.1 UMP kinase [Leptospiraceae bacterium]
MEGSRGTKQYVGKLYRRVLIKLSGEILAGEDRQGINVQVVKQLAEEIIEVHRLGVEVAIVIGGGNFWRGEKAEAEGMDRVTADYMGMMATVMNGLALQDFLERMGLISRLQTAIEIRSVAEPFIRRKAIRHLEKKRVVILAAGTGNPYFTTDTTAALRAIELGADIIFKATKVNGVYEADPAQNPAARRYRQVSFMDALQKQLKVMDSTAFSLCMDNRMPIQVFDIRERGNLKKVVQGSEVGTLIRHDVQTHFY